MLSQKTQIEQEAGHEKEKMAANGTGDFIIGRIIGGIFCVEKS